MSNNKYRKPRRRNARRAFTLIEIIVVTTIIALLATLIVPRVWQHVGKSKITVAKAEVQEIAKQITLYLATNGMSKPPEDMDLTLLTTGNDPYLKPKDLIDPWNRPYLLQVPGVENFDFDVYSLGADGQAGGDDEDADIYNE